MLGANTAFCDEFCEREYRWNNRTCSICGGEFWDGGTSCDCEDWESYDTEIVDDDEQSDCNVTDDDLPF